MGFTLHNSARGWDRGFIRVIADGSLVGLVWKETDAATTAQSVVAVPEATIDGQAGAAYRFPTPATDADADAIKYLGYDYAHAGKHRAAVDALSKSIKFYQSQAKASGDPREQESQLLKQDIPIYTLIYTNSYTKALTTSFSWITIKFLAPFCASIPVIVSAFFITIRT